jgi:hypothetical protein
LVQSPLGIRFQQGRLKTFKADLYLYCPTPLYVAMKLLAFSRVFALNMNAWFGDFPISENDFFHKGF